MTLAPRLRRALLLAHIASSVGRLGVVAAYIALDLTAVTSRDEQLVRAAYLAMEVTVQWVVVPLTTVVVGVLTALGTPWGLLRHYRVLVELLLTVLATAVLLAETPTIGSLAGAARTVAGAASSCCRWSWSRRWSSRRA